MKLCKILSALVVLWIFAQPASAQSNNASAELLKNIYPAEIDSVVNSYEGEKAVLVNIWATWCGPCVEEFPHIVELQKKYRDQLRVVFISADMKKDRERVVNFLNKHNVDWTTFFKRGNDQEFLRRVDEEWNGALPFTKIYSVNGSVVDSWYDKADYETFQNRIEQAIKTES